MTDGSRVVRASGNISNRFLPRTVSRGCRETRAIHSFQPTMRCCWSRTMIPMSTASKAGPYSKSDTSSSIAGGFLSRSLSFDCIDEFAHDLLQRHNRRQVHEQGDEALDVTLPDREIDVEEQNQAVVQPFRPTVEQRRAVSAHNGGKRHPHGATQGVGNRGQASVQNDIPGLRQGFLLEVDDVLERVLAPDDRPDEFEAVRLR